jgi:hypothetical protein
MEMASEEADEEYRPNWVLRGCAGLLLACLLLVVTFCAWIEHHDRLATWLPAKLELSDRYWSEGQEGILSYCGTSLYGLTPRTLRAIQSQGLAFFDDAWQPRDPKLPRRFVWAETPLGRSGRESGVQPVFECAPHPDPALQRNVYRALAAPGSYWAHDADHSLYVFPSLGIVLSVHAD